MHIHADDIHTVAHLNDVRYISLVYIAYTNNAAIMICFSLSVCITKKNNESKIDVFMSMWFIKGPRELPWILQFPDPRKSESKGS